MLKLPPARPTRNVLPTGFTLVPAAPADAAVGVLAAGALLHAANNRLNPIAATRAARLLPPSNRIGSSMPYCAAGYARAEDVVAFQVLMRAYVLDMGARDVCATRVQAFRELAIYVNN